MRCVARVVVMEVVEVHRVLPRRGRVTEAACVERVVLETLARGSEEAKIEEEFYEKINMYGRLCVT